MASNQKRRQFASTPYARQMAQTLPRAAIVEEKLESYELSLPSRAQAPIVSPSAPTRYLERSFSETKEPVIPLPLPLPLPQPSPQPQPSPSSSSIKMGISLPQVQTQQVQQVQTQQVQQTQIQVKSLINRHTVYQPLPSLKNNFMHSSTGFARAMRNHVWGEHVFMFESIPESDDWSEWAACADTHATADEWLEVILPGFELNGVAWFIVRGIDADSGSLQFYFCPRNDRRGNPILGEFGSMPRFDASQVSVVDGKV